MKPLPGTIHGGGDLFAPTHWSVVLAAGQSEQDPPAAAAALAQLCQIYWASLYTFVRGRGYARHDAQDLTQSFFAHLLARKISARVDPQKGKFRSFLLVSIKHFLADAHDRERTLKRGGACVLPPLNDAQIEGAESLFQSSRHDAPSAVVAHADRLFELAWAEALVDAARRRLSESYRAEGKQKLLDDLDVFLTGSAAPLPAYDELAARLGTPASTLRSHVARSRANYREALRAEVRRTVGSEAEVDGELRKLLRVLTAAR